jgi:hypothetical protein
MERSDSPWPIRRPSCGWPTLPSFQRRTRGLPGSWHLSSCVPRSLTPAGPRGSHRERSLRVGFRTANTVSTCANEVTRLNRLEECGLPCGPQDSLCTLRMHCSAIQGVAQSYLPFIESCIDLFDNLRCIRNTRYGWLVRPCPTGTLTPQEMPSFAWRTNSSRNKTRNGTVGSDRGHHSAWCPRKRHLSNP